MSDQAPAKFKISGKLSLVSQSGKARVTVSDGPGADTGPEPGPEQAAEQALRASYEAGRRDGMAEREKQLAPQIESLKNQINLISSEIPAAISAYFAELEAQAKEEIMDLSLKLAEIILREKIKEEEVLRPLIQDALSPLTDLSGVKIQLSPSIAARVKASGGAAEGIPPGVEISANPKLSDGEVVVESSQGLIDGTLSGRLETLRGAFAEALSEHNDKNLRNQNEE
jgi:flagellar biosynthesis/type III secretory pathway protein FliH